MANSSTSIPERVNTALRELASNTESQPTVMPAEFYTDESLLSIEEKTIFHNSWLCVGRADEVPRVGDFYTLEIVGEPLIVTRSSRNEIRVLSNVCRHRGSIIATDSGNSRRFTCPYHKWAYELDGSLARAPLVDKTPGFDKKQCALPVFRSTEWMGFLFVNLDGQAEEFAIQTEGVDAYVQNYHTEEMRTVKASPECWPVNWKCLSENFMEGYHLTPVHLKTLHPMTPTRLCEKIPGGKGYTGYKSHYDEKFPGRKPFHKDMTEEERNQSMMIWIYPSFVAAISPNSAVYMGITPTAATELQTRWGVIAREELFEQGEAEARYDFARSFNTEDKARLVSVQQGLASRYTTRSPLAPPDYEGTVWDFYHYMARKLSNHLG